MLLPPANGLITYTEEYSPTFGFMEMATYDCNAGFGLSGGDTVRTCVGFPGATGVWNGTAPVCEGEPSSWCLGVAGYSDRALSSHVHQIYKLFKSLAE